MPAELLITLRDGQTCCLTIPPSDVAQTIEITRASIDKGRMGSRVKGPSGMTTEYKKAALQLTKGQQPK